MADIWQPQPGPQALAVAAAFIDELLYGGARGGGKTSFLLGDFLQDIDYGPGWTGIFFRRSYPELEEAIKQSKSMYTPLGAVWKVSERTWHFPSGATLKMRHLDNEQDADLYQGHEYPWIGWDELGNWPNLTSYDRLKACLRTTDPRVLRKRIRASANPGGPGHHAVRAYFIDHAPLGFQRIVGEHGMTRMFIPAKLTDNQILMTVDPGYVDRLRSLGSKELVRAWLEGDWNVVTGAYFPELSLNKHVIEPFTIPPHLMQFLCGDWGSAKPFAFYWIAVSDGNLQIPPDPFAPPGSYSRLIPKGALIVFREFYGCMPGMVNVGLRWPAFRVAQGILQRDREGERRSYGVMDPSAFKQDGGPSHGEVMARNGVWLRPADNSRLSGWGQIRARLAGEDGDPDIDNGVGTPMLYIFNTCPHLIRTLSALQHDKDDPEDCDTDGEDHGPDALRYGCMSRPWVRPSPLSIARHPDRPAWLPPSVKIIQEVTLMDLFQDREAGLTVSLPGL